MKKNLRILAITCYTGGEGLVRMTEKMLQGLKSTVPTDSCEMRVSITAQGAERMVDFKLFHYANTQPKNISFAFGMNHAIETALSLTDKPDYVLCMNNDLEFTQPAWFRILLQHAQIHKVVCPVTDRTALHAQRGPIMVAPTDVDDLSAYCWLVPFGLCEFLKCEHGFHLFSEDFRPGFGEDNWTSYLFTKKLGPKVFRLVRRSFVKHLRHQTTKAVLHDRGKTSKILADKLRVELKDNKLRPDLKVWINRYLKLLKC